MEVVEPANKAAEPQPPAFRFPALEAPPIGRRAWFGTLLVHALGIAALLAVPRGVFTMGSPAGHSGRVTLVAPPLELTRKAPAQGPIGRESSLENLAPRPPLRMPPAIPPIARNRPETPVFLPEPPSLENTRIAAAPTPLGASALPAPPPQILPEEKPKLAFETPGAYSSAPKPMGLGQPRISRPSSSVTEAARAAIQAGPGGTVVGDVDVPPSPGLGAGTTLAPAPGKTATRIEMASDPMGVDFKPYLIQILASVKRNWLSVYPESARLGLAGRVRILFAINRDGSIPKLVISTPSGQDALDRAAVAGISASNPFPPLPADFRGSQIRLAFTFTYNMK